MQTHATVSERKPIIGIGPNMQHRADQIGSRLVETLSKQAEAMTLSLRLYRMYLAECQQRKLRSKQVNLARPAKKPVEGLKIAVGS